jgi:DNA replication protein DnaC
LPFDGKLLAQARVVLEAKRRLNDDLYERRLARVYASAPSVRALDIEIRKTMTALVDAALSSGSEYVIEDIRLKNIKLQEQRRTELVLAGYIDTYLDDDYMCTKCRDTGHLGTNICSCLMDLYKEEQRKSLSNIFKLGDETFASFDLS